MRLAVPCSLVLALAACSGDDAHGRHPTTPIAVAPADAGVAVDAAPAGPAVAPLHEDMAQPYFADGDAGTGAERFALEDWTAARASFALYRDALPASAAVEHARATLMIALCDAELGRWRAAGDGFERALAGLPVLADWIRYQGARARYLDHQLDAAQALAAAIAADSIVGADAELLTGDILRSRGDSGAVAAHYRGYLERRPDGIRRSEARYRLAEALEQAPQLSRDAATLHEVVDLYRAIGIEDPLSSWATKAGDRLTALSSGLPADERKRIGVFTADELIARGKVYFDAMRNPLSEADFAAVLALPGITDEQRCIAGYNRAQSFFKDRDRKAAAPAFDEAAPACKAAGNNDLLIKSYYQGGRAYAYLKDHAHAVERYQQASKIDPAHSFTDDAVLREAEEWADLGDDAKVRATLARIPAEFPAGDMRAEALWRLGWRDWRDGKAADALAHWRAQIQAMPIDDNYWAEGQAQYWIGRAQAALGKPDDAIASWVDTVKTYPVTYYAMLALNRLREVAPDRYNALVIELARDPPGFDPAAPAFTFKPREEYATPGFARAMELLRLGLGEPAEAELRALKLTAPPGKLRVDDPDQIEKLWAMAFLYDRAGRYGTSHWPTRWHILDYKRQWPVGANAARWRIAYPHGYWDLLSKAADEQQVPVELQIAIVREESAFDPLLESWANAIGLTQMIFPTAERFAKGTGIAVSRETLRDPEKNVAIGSRFLGFLFKKWRGTILLVPPSYNAGEGGVTRMLRVRGTWAADEFIEGIVDDQARNYSKRVLGSFFAYTWIYRQAVPEIGNVIPADLLPAPAAAPAPAPAVKAKAKPAKAKKRRHR